MPQPLYASAVLPAERRRNDIILGLAVGLATIPIVLMTAPHWPPHMPACAAPQVQADSPAPAPALAPATSTPGGCAGSSFPSCSIVESPGLCTTAAAGALTFLVSMVAQSCLAGLCGDRPAAVCTLWPAAVGHHRCILLVAALLLGRGVLASQAVATAVLMRVFHWDLWPS